MRREAVDRFLACWLPDKSPLIEKMIRDDIDELLAAENAALKEALEDISMERQNFTDRFSRQGLDDAHKLFDLADAALASPTETAKEGVDD